MVLTKVELNKHLSVLEIIDDIETVFIRDVDIAFRKLALVKHPDKAGGDFKEEFQELLCSYRTLLTYFKEKNIEDDDLAVDDTDDDKFFKDYFERFNFPFENKGSFTVSIEDLLADTWQECIEHILGAPKVVINAHGTECDRIWKVSYNNIEITIHMYNKPKNKKGSKLMLQGGIQSMICSYVFMNFPKSTKWL